MHDKFPLDTAMLTATWVQVLRIILHFSHVYGPREPRTSESNADPLGPPATPIANVSDETATRKAPKAGSSARRRENSTVRTARGCKRIDDDADQAQIRD